jgi:hypothetical protein
MPDNLQEIIDRVKAGNHSPEDIQAIESAIQSGNLVLVLVDGSGAVGFGGNAVDSPIVTGSNNTIIQIYGVDAQAIQAVLATSFPQGRETARKVKHQAGPVIQNQSPNSLILVGFLIDVSASMISSASDRLGSSSKRIDNFRESLHKAVNRMKNFPDEAKNSQRFFALGFGFGSFHAYLLGDAGEKVRDLFTLPNISDPTVSLKQLIDNWEEYDEYIRKMVWRMGGGTPMKQALLIAEKRFEEEAEKYSCNNQQILFVISDGVPTDSSANEVALIASRLRDDKKILIISCYLTNNDMVKPNCLYNESLHEWEEGAKLLFECASEAIPGSPPYDDLKEDKWEIPPTGQSEVSVVS